MGGLTFALILGIIVAYMVLTSPFNSLLRPVTVLTILPPHPEPHAARASPGGA